MTEPALTVRDLQPGNCPAVRRLILTGLEEHWGWLDESLNPDLHDLLASYSNETFLTAWLGDRLVGAGALVKEAEGVGRIVRMSVEKDARRAGIGRALLNELRCRAVARGFTRLVLETTDTWQDARGFYEKHGFRLLECRDGDAHYALDL